MYSCHVLLNEYGQSDGHKDERTDKTDMALAWDPDQENIYVYTNVPVFYLDLNNWFSLKILI